MTEVYVITAVVCLLGCMFGAYLVGKADGREEERERTSRRIYLVVQDIFKTIEAEQPHHALTHADMVQMEVEATNKKTEQQK